MDAKMIGFICFIREQNCPLSNPSAEDYAKWIKGMYVVYCKQYPNGLTAALYPVD